jgi:hypothetical protein
MALSQIAHTRPSTTSAALEIMYGVPPLDLFIQNCAQNAFLLRQSTIIDLSRNPPLGDVSYRLCGEDNETPIHIICDCGHFISHRLNTIGVHQMPE